MKTAEELYKVVWGKTLLPPTVFRLLYNHVRNIINLNIEGDFIECGVYKGGSARMIAEMLPLNKKLWCFDTFTGFTKEEEKKIFVDREKSVNLSLNDTTVETVSEFLKDFNVNIIQGKVENTLQNFNTKICFGHIDCDSYDATKFCLEKLYPLLNEGGIIVFDDYTTVEESKRVINEFCLRDNKIPLYVGDMYGGAYSQIYIIKEK